MKLSVWLRGVFLILWGSSASLNAFSGKLTSANETLSLSQIKVLADPEGQLRSLRFDEIWQSPSFIERSSWKEKTVAHVDYWSRIRLSNNKIDQVQHMDWVLEFDIGITEIEVFIRRENGVVEKYRTGFFQTLSKKSFTPTAKSNLVKIDLGPNEEVDVLVLMRSIRPSLPPEFSVKLLPTDEYYNQLKLNKQGNMLYLGFVLMMLIYNLFMFAFRSDKANIYYSLYLFFIALYISYNTGDLHDWIQDFLTPDHPQYMYVFKLSTYLSLICYMKFVRHFLSLEELLPKWDRYLKYASFAAIPFMILDVFLMKISNFSPNVSDIATVTYIFLFIVLTIAMLIPVYRTTDQKRHYIVYGMLAMITGIFITLILRFQSYHFPVLPFKIGSIIEIIIFSMGLVYRQQEKEVQQRVVAYELEKSLIIQEQEQRETARLKELNEFKSDVYANITHEFKTPLMVIMGMAENLPSVGQEKEIIRRNSQDLLRLINQLLDLSKAESNQLILHYRYDDVVSYIKYLFESITSAGKRKNIEFKLTTNRDQIYTSYDEGIIKHIIENLLVNAIKFTDEGGVIELQLLEIVPDGNGERYLEVNVIDNGIGIPTQDLEKVFDRFYQSPEGKSIHKGGTGLGLSLVKELTERIGGTVSVTSTYNEGARFTVRLPITSKGVETEIVKYPNGEQANRQSHQPIPNGISTEKPLILLVEDNEDVMTYIHSCLEPSYSILESINGVEGLDKALHLIPDLVITDIMMPQMNGLELCQKLKVDKRTSHIPVIMLTGKTDRDVRLKALNYGADAFLTKPFDRQELLIRVESMIKLRQGLKEKYGAQLQQSESNGDPFINELKEYITQNMHTQDFSVEHLQEWSGMSRTQLYRKVKAVSNMSAHQFLTWIRLEKGKRLLEQSELTIGEIAYKIGYSDPNYFSRKFTQTYQSTPKKYRELNGALKS